MKESQAKSGAHDRSNADPDEHAGQIAKAVDDAGIPDNTIVVWTSDKRPQIGNDIAYGAVSVGDLMRVTQRSKAQAAQSQFAF